MPTENSSAILVIDDEQAITRVVGRLIEDILEEKQLRERYSIIEENNPVKALARIKGDGIDLALAISDIMMPEMDGLELLKAVKDLYPDAPRIILTGYADKQNAIQAINEIGLSYYVEKPWQDEVFNYLILNALGQYRQAKIETMFGLYVPVEIIENYVDQSNSAILNGQTLTATILFLDFVDFSRCTKKMDAQATVKLLNGYFSEMVDIINTHKGILDKYTGDGLMALFGVPKPTRDSTIDATNAVLAALDIVQNIQQIGNKYTDTELKPFRVRIGINTGKVLAGNIGSKNRVNYTVVGEPVNTASRIENAARDFLNGDQGCILISQATYKEVQTTLRGKATFKSQGPVRLKGDETLHLYKVSHG